MSVGRAVHRHQRWRRAFAGAATWRPSSESPWVAAGPRFRVDGLGCQTAAEPLQYRAAALHGGTDAAQCWRRWSIVVNAATDLCSARR
eukprot:4025641-Pyramimonas_sp.AAC.1